MPYAATCRLERLSGWRCTGRPSAAPRLCSSIARRRAARRQPVGPAARRRHAAVHAQRGRRQVHALAAVGREQRWWRRGQQRQLQAAVASEWRRSVFVGGRDARRRHPHVRSDGGRLARGQPHRRVAAGSRIGEHTDAWAHRRRGRRGRRATCATTPPIAIGAAACPHARPHQGRWCTWCSRARACARARACTGRARPSRCTLAQPVGQPTTCGDQAAVGACGALGGGARAALVSEV